MHSPTVHHVLGTSFAPPFPEGFEVAVIGMGCFWGAERLFWSLEGVHTTAVGYSGGHSERPSYREVCSAPRIMQKSCSSSSIRR